LSSFGSLLIGSFGIIGQNRIKRLMAFSSINHVSFLLLGIACGTLSGLVTTLLYLIVYSLTLFFFFCILLNINCLITGRSLIYLSDFANLTKTSSFGSASLLIILFSMGGLPPLAGFFVKLYIYIEAISSGFFIFVFLSLVVTIISTFYYLFFLKSIFFDKTLWSKLISLKMLRSICIYIIIAACLFLVGFMFIIPFIYTAVVAMSCSLYSPF
jgi:NADH-quinone oxidoreductase subunit N